jgi:hypothetical protein
MSIRPSIIFNQGYTSMPSTIVSIVCRLAEALYSEAEPFAQLAARGLVKIACRVKNHYFSQKRQHVADGMKQFKSQIVKILYNFVIHSREKSNIELLGVQSISISKDFLRWLLKALHELVNEQQNLDVGMFSPSLTSALVEPAVVVEDRKF